MSLENLSNHERNQIDYWSDLANLHTNPFAQVHWIDENDRPVDYKMFLDIAAWCFSKIENKSGSLQILEIGCGNGLLLKALFDVANSQSIKSTIFGTDISRELLNLCPNEFKVFIAAANKQPFDSNKFDLILVHSVIQYFESEKYLDEVLIEIHRLLKVGGKMMLLDVLNKNLIAQHASTTSLYLLFYKIYAALPSAIKNSYRQFKFLIKGRNAIRNTETVFGQKIKVPEFKGLACEPESLNEQLKTLYSTVDFHLQTYRSKPNQYRLWRYNVVASGPTKI